MPFATLRNERDACGPQHHQAAAELVLAQQLLPAQPEDRHRNAVDQHLAYNMVVPAGGPRLAEPNMQHATCNMQQHVM